MLKAVIRAVSDKMHQRIADLVHHCPVKLCLLTGDGKLHLLVKLLLKVAHHTGEFLDCTLDRHHPYLHDCLMEIGGYAFEIFNLLIESLSGGITAVRC